MGRKHRTAQLGLALTLGLLVTGTSLAARKPNPDFLFDALERRRDGRLNSREFETFLDPPRFRSRVIYQVRRKMGFLGNLPGLQGLMSRFGKEPPFARRNHAAWVEEYDQDGDGTLSDDERRIAAMAIMARADGDRDGRLDREEFRQLLKERRRVLDGEPEDSSRSATLSGASSPPRGGGRVSAR